MASSSPSKLTAEAIPPAWKSSLFTVIDFLKQHGAAIRLEDLAIHTRVDALTLNPDFYAFFVAHDRVVHDAKLGLYSYKPDFNIRNPAQVLELVKKYSPRGGFPVKKLKESWANVGTAIEDLEKQGKVLVVRTGGKSEEEGNMKAVFLDEVGKVPQVDDEFRTMWTSFRTPDPSTVESDLRLAGLAATSAAEAPRILKNAKKGKKAGAGRRYKITNTHLKDQGIDLSKDYVPGA